MKSIYQLSGFKYDYLSHNYSVTKSYMAALPTQERKRTSLLENIWMSLLFDTYFF